METSPTSDSETVTQPDFVLVFQRHSQSLKSRESAEFKANYRTVVCRILKVGLDCEAIALDKSGRVALLITATPLFVQQEAFKCRVNDWLNSVGSADLSTKGPSVSPAERVRLVHDVLVSPTFNGGAGITLDQVPEGVDACGGECIEALFPLHDDNFNAEWLYSWNSKWILTHEDLTLIRDHHGEEVAYYFCFTQFYCLALAVPSAVAVATSFFLKPFSAVYIFCLLIWSIAFLASWSKQSQFYSILWGTRHFNFTEKLRPQFVPDAFEQDPVSGQPVATYPNWKRLLKVIFVRVPFEVCILVVLTVLCALIFAFEMGVTVYYDGPLKNIAALTPTLVYVLCIPTLSAVHSNLAKKLTQFENYGTESSHTASLTRKIFLFTSVISYLAPLLMSFYYIPFAGSVLSVASSLGFDIKESFKPTVQMLEAVVFYYTVTGQVINALTETIVPMMHRKLKSLFARFSSPRISTPSPLKPNNFSKEEILVQKILQELSLPSYDVYVDYAEMVSQFGYIVLFSPVFPFASLASFINNFLELRSDALKICINVRRPIPARAEDIGPWMSSLNVLSWIGSLTCAGWWIFYGHGVDGDEVRNSFGLKELAIVVGFEHLWFLLRCVYMLFLLQTLAFD